MHLLLFDWNLGGHHTRYLRHFVLAVQPAARVTVAAPDSVLAELSDLPIDFVSLGCGRPAVQVAQPQAAQNASLAAEELALMEAATHEVKPDHVVNLYGDPVIRWFVRRRQRFPAPVTFCMFFVRDHYRQRFGSRFSFSERVRANFLRFNLQRFRRRSDAHSLLFLDAEAVEVYQGRRGVPVHWFPEPPIMPLRMNPGSGGRSGFTIYGALAPRKGIDWVAAAVCEHASSTEWTFAGPVDPQFEPELQGHIDRMRECGADVNLRLYRHDEESSLRLLARSKATVLAYPAHYGMSRVLLESCSVQTPIIAHDFGLLGHLVRRHELGAVVDCSNSRLLGEALIRVAAEPEWVERHQMNLVRFNRAYSVSVFRSAIANAFFGGQLVAEPEVAAF